MTTSLKFSDLTTGKPQKVTLGDKDICVVRVNEEVFAVADICSHAEASLSEGEVSGEKIECWLHGAEFNLRTGEAITPPATESLEVYEVKRDGDSVTIQERRR
ncbi:MAG: non-heme iron oxygenase ferredoxin subunit [Actinobacteria bacterium]|nr:non-heme iron oxygenase ferredoxin subunit [Actinomycetota bacterium]